jgi:aminoglycoside phosphotransferase (APT) family kinase protein
LPVTPKVKTLSEVATLAYVREKTSIPVPKVVAYDADLTNELGFEYIRMERVDGHPLREM